MSRPVVIALVGLVTAAIALILAWSLTRETPTGETPERQAPVAAQPVPAVPATPRAEAVAPAAPAAGPEAPSFDVVRIGEGGDTVVAGRAMPKAEVTILDGDREIGRTIADARGEWVFVPDLPLPPGGRELSLRADNPDGSQTLSDVPVVLVVPEHGQPMVLKPLPEGGTALIQGPRPAEEVAGAGGPVIDVVDYDASQRLFVGGHAAPDAKLNLYLDNEFIGSVTANPQGDWRLEARAPGAGEHTLRVDQVEEGGKVRARAETPFTPADDLKPGEGRTVVVAPGNSLWRIARSIYGSGLAYTVIYQANKDRIRDPDLIYPGQVFTTPAR